MMTYIIKNANNKIIFKSDNYVETLNYYQQLKKIDNQWLTIYVLNNFNK